MKLVFALLIAATAFGQVPTVTMPSPYWVGADNPDSLFGFYLKFPPSLTVPDTMWVSYAQFNGTFANDAPVFAHTSFPALASDADSTVVVIPGVHRKSGFYLEWCRANAQGRSTTENIYGLLFTHAPVPVYPPNGSMY